MVMVSQATRVVRAGRGRWYELFRLSVEWHQQHQHQQSVTAPAPGDTYQPPAASGRYQQILADTSSYQLPADTSI